MDHAPGAGLITRHIDLQSSVLWLSPCTMMYWCSTLSFYYWCTLWYNNILYILRYCFSTTTNAGLPKFVLDILIVWICWYYFLSIFYHCSMVKYSWKTWGSRRSQWYSRSRTLTTSEQVQGQTYIRSMSQGQGHLQCQGLLQYQGYLQCQGQTHLLII